MEKQLPVIFLSMKFLSWASLATVLFISACANNPKSSDPPAPTSTPATAPSDPTKPAPNATAASTATPTATVLISPPPVIPIGPLSPVEPARAATQNVANLTAPTDLWDRIRRGYAMPNLEGEGVRDREQYYATRPDYLQRMSERSRKYMFHIVEELERRNMPSELALLPFIESAFNPQAVSSAKAAGMWQFMPATGTHFSLKQNVFRDDRRDVLASTRAALDYLQKLHGMFGDWHLALAAYNWGEGSVGRAIARNQKEGKGTAYTDLNMPNETRQYVPKLQAIKNIVANPEAFRSELPPIANHPYFQTVVITRDIDVALAARLADVKLEDFKALNPSANRPIILAAGTPQILLPWDNATVFERNLQAHGSGQSASWTAWTAPATLSVAAAAQRVGMTEAELRSANNIPPRMLIRTGSTLLVSRSAKVQNDVTGQVADNGQLSLAPEVVTRRTTVKARKGETVASLAGRYQLNPGEVATWNKTSAGAAFKAGQQVVVYLQVKAHSKKAPARAARNAAPAKASKVKVGATRGKAVVKKPRR
jgi:membrane-bound lytic murein transglycosylase D